MCPECRTDHFVPDQGVQNIMDNEAMTRLIETRQVSVHLLLNVKIQIGLG